MPQMRRRILCAESNKDVSDLIVLLLEQKGYEVKSVRTAAECLSVAAAERFNLFILNDSYIDADSVELCRQLRALYPDTPALLFSLDTTESYRPRVRETGAYTYLSKTSDFVALVQTIDSLLDS